MSGIRSIRSVIIDGRRYAVKVTTRHLRVRDGVLANCDSPRDARKAIRIHPLIADEPEELMETIIHEGLHAAGWHLDENWVDQTAKDLGRFLWRAGFRLTEEY